MTNNLFDRYGNLRYYEAVDRLKYWTRDLSDEPARSSIRILLDLLSSRELTFDKQEQSMEETCLN